MGMGEPLLNLREVLKAHAFLNKQLGIGARHITISTVGVPNAIARLASEQLQSTLAVSLHAPNQALRETLVPR
jgi:23S rRNA (adenine2503-C2)-methyltransferase